MRPTFEYIGFLSTGFARLDDLLIFILYDSDDRSSEQWATYSLQHIHLQTGKLQRLQETMQEHGKEVERRFFGRCDRHRDAGE